MAWTISRIELSSPPGVSSASTTRPSPSRSARSRACRTERATNGSTTPVTGTRSTAGAKRPRPLAAADRSCRAGRPRAASRPGSRPGGRGTGRPALRPPRPTPSATASLLQRPVLVVEALGDQEAPGPLGQRVAGHQPPELRGMVRHGQVDELVDEHVVTHPAREGGQPVGEPDGAVLRRTRAVAGAHVPDPAHRAWLDRAAEVAPREHPGPADQLIVALRLEPALPRVQALDRKSTRRTPV